LSLRMATTRVDISSHQRHTSALVAALVAGLSVAMLFCARPCGAQGGILGNYRITAVPNPRSVAADGKTAARIRIEVRDTNGQPAPDGTKVVVSTDLGYVGESEFDRTKALTVETASGFAMVFASSDTAGLATIRISVGASRSNNVYLEFRPEGQEAGPELRVVQVDGTWVGYSVDLNIIEARDHALVGYGGMTVSEADIVQLDVDTMDLRAEPAIVTRDDQEISGQNLFFQVYSKRGALRQFTDDGIEQVGFDLYSLEAQSLDWDLPYNAFDFLPAVGETWLVADSITLFVGEKIVLRNADVYVGGDKVMSLPPYWVLAMPGYTGASHSQILGVNSAGGLAVDLPFFYRVTGTRTGAVELRRGAPSGSVIAREGWGLGLREEYHTQNAEGELVLAGLPRSDWGMEWRDTRQVFGGALGDFSVGWPDHHSIFADANIFDYGSSYRSNVRAYYHRPEYAATTYGLFADWLTSPRRLPTGSNNTYRLGLSLGAYHSSKENRGLIFDNELYGKMDLGAWRLASQTWLAFDVDNIYSWDTADYSANSAQAQLTLERGFGRNVTMFVDYFAEYGSGDAYHQGWHEGLGLNGWASFERWSAYLRGNWDLTDNSTLASADVSYYLNNRWRLVLLGTHYDFEETSYDDVELGIGWKVLQGRELGLRWSHEEGRFSVELGNLTSSF